MIKNKINPLHHPFRHCYLVFYFCPFPEVLDFFFTKKAARESITGHRADGLRHKFEIKKYALVEEQKCKKISGSDFVLLSQSQKLYISGGLRMNRKAEEKAAEIELNRAVKTYTRAEKRWRNSHEYDYFADPPPSLTRAYRRKEEALRNYRAMHKAVSVWLHKKNWTPHSMEVGKSVTKAELRKVLVEACLNICANADAKSIRIGRWRKL